MIMITLTTSVLTCEQTLLGALAAGREKELSTTSLEFDYLHRKYRCETLMGGGDISNDVITLGTCFSMSVYIRARFRFMLIGRNLTSQSTGSHRGIGDVATSSPSFSRLAARAPRRACSQAISVSTQNLFAIGTMFFFFRMTVIVTGSEIKFCY